MARRRFSLGRILGQVIGWSCFIAAAFDTWMPHH
jgi:hypothetical protein